MSERRRAEAKRLHDVVGGLRQRHGVVDRQRAERRGPGQAGTDRRAHDIGIGNLHRLGRALVAEYAAGIDERGRLQAVLVGNAGYRALQFGRRRPVRAAADIIHGRSRRQVARAKAVGRKSPHHGGATEEIVHQRHLLAAPAGDVAALAANHGDEIAVERMIVAKVFGGAQEFHVAAETGEILAELRPDAAGRGPEVVERAVGRGAAGGGYPCGSGSRSLLDGPRRRETAGIRSKRDVLVVDRVSPLHAEFLGQRRAEQQPRAVGAGAIGLVAGHVGLPAEQFDAGRYLGTEKIGLRGRKVDTARVLAEGEGRLKVGAGAVKIPFAELDLDERAVRGRIAARDEEVAGRLIDGLDIEHDAIRRRSRPLRYLHGLEVVQVSEAPLGPVDQGLVVGIAFRDIEFAPDHVVAGAVVAVDFDALDIGPGALIDHEGNIDASRGLIADESGRCIREGVAKFRHLDRQDFGGLVEGVAVERCAGTGENDAGQLPGIEARNIAGDADIAEAVERAFVDHEGHRKSLRRGIVFRVGRAHIGIGIALAAIVESEAARGPVRCDRGRRRHRRSACSSPTSPRS